MSELEIQLNGVRSFTLEELCRMYWRMDKRAFRALVADAPMFGSSWTSSNAKTRIEKVLARLPGPTGRGQLRATALKRFVHRLPAAGPGLAAQNSYR